MKHIRIKLLILFLLSAISFSEAQEKENFNYFVTVGSGLSSKTTLPFWLESNRFGSVPNTDHLLLNASIYSNLKKEHKDFGIAYKLNATGFVGNENTTTGYIADGNKILLNELYVRLQYKNWALDLGNINDEVKWNGLSSSNGNIVKSLNARAIPGINIKTLDYMQLPFAKNLLRFQLNLSNYWMNDKRSIDNVMLHHKSLYLKFITSPKFSILAGLDHYVQWGGTSADLGNQPSSFKDFIRVFAGMKGGTSASESDQINKLGNTVGHYLFQLNYKGHKTHLNFYYSHPFEDGSGREMQNWRDGLYGVYVNFKKPNAFVTHILTEFTYTKHMSGASPPDQGYDENGNSIPGRGRDNYFSYTLYNGWTSFGNTIGSPYFTTKPVDENGITPDIIVGDNRFMAYNVGVRGTIKRIHYKAMLSHTTYFGWFTKEYEIKPTQFSGLLELNVSSLNTQLPFDISLAGSFDTGTYRPVNFGGFLTLSKSGMF